MKHLISIINNETNHEANKPKGVFKRGGTPKNKRIHYNFNGYTFFLTRKDWASHLNIGYGTINSRCRNKNNNAAQILGFENIIKKKAGAKKGSKRDFYDTL